MAQSAIMDQQYPNEFQRKTLWRALTGLAITVLGLHLVLVVWLTGTVLSYLQPVLLPVAISGIVAYLLDPLVSWLQSKGVTRLKSVIAVFSSFSLAIVLMALMIIPPIVGQANKLVTDEQLGVNVSTTIKSWGNIPWIKPAAEWALAERREEASETAEDTIDTPVSAETDSPETDPDSPWGEPEQEPANSNNLATTDKTPFKQTNLAHHLTVHAGRITNYGLKFITAGTSTILASLGLIIGLAMVPIYLYYFLKESAAIKEHWHDYVPLKASAFKTEVVETLQEINGYLISFFRGQMLVAFIDGILVGIALFAFGLPYALVIGLAMAILGVIPFIGNIICLIPACIIAFIHFGIAENREHLEWLLGTSGWAYVAAVCAIFFIVQQINSLVTAPKIVGDSVGLHPMTVIFSMLFWSLMLGGFLGALMAVPLTAAVKVLLRRYIWERKLNQLQEEST